MAFLSSFSNSLDSCDYGFSRLLICSYFWILIENKRHVDWFLFTPTYYHDSTIICINIFQFHILLRYVIESNAFLRNCLTCTPKKFIAEGVKRPLRSIHELRRQLLTFDQFQKSNISSNFIRDRFPDSLKDKREFRLSKLDNCWSAVFEDCGRPLILFTPMLSVAISFRVQVFLNRNPHSTRFLVESWLFYYIANFQLLKFLKFQMTNIINLFLLFVLFSYRW